MSQKLFITVYAQLHVLSLQCSSVHRAQGGRARLSNIAQGQRLRAPVRLVGPVCLLQMG